MAWQLGCGSRYLRCGNDWLDKLLKRQGHGLGEEVWVWWVWWCGGCGAGQAQRHKITQKSRTRKLGLGRNCNVRGCPGQLAKFRFNQAPPNGTNKHGHFPNHSCATPIGPLAHQVMQSEADIRGCVVFKLPLRRNALSRHLVPESD